MGEVCTVSPVGRKETTKCHKCNHAMGNHRNGDTCWICAFSVGAK